MRPVAAQLRRGCRAAAAVDPSEENPRLPVRRSSRCLRADHRETRTRHPRSLHEGQTARPPARSRPRETAHRRIRRGPRADHAARASPVPLADENRHDPTRVVCELDSRRTNLTPATGSIESEQSAASRPSCFVPHQQSQPHARGAVGALAWPLWASSSHDDPAHDGRTHAADIPIALDQGPARWLGEVTGAGAAVPRLHMQTVDPAHLLASPGFGDQGGGGARLSAIPFFARAVWTRANR